MSYKVLHTADLHLNRVGDERWLALEQLVALGRKEGQAWRLPAIFLTATSGPGTPSYLRRALSPPALRW